MYEAAFIISAPLTMQQLNVCKRFHCRYDAWHLRYQLLKIPVDK